VRTAPPRLPTPNAGPERLPAPNDCRSRTTADPERLPIPNETLRPRSDGMRVSLASGSRNAKSPPSGAGRGRLL
jgi:hypothetical protein